VIVTLTANPSLDKTYHVDELVREGVNRVTRVTVEAAGKGVNVARGLSGNGFAATAVVPIGGSDAQRYESLLTEAGVPYVAVPISGNVRTNVSVIEASGATTKLNEAGPTLSEAESDALIDAAVGACTEGDWLAACGSLPPGVPRDFYARIADRAHGVGSRVAVDASGAALEAAVHGRPDLIKPNVEELRQLTGARLTTMAEVVDAARDLVGRGVGAVLVSLGAAGAVLVNEREAVHGAAAVDRVRNTVGAGDTLLAGYLAGGSDVQEALVSALTWARAAIRSAETAMATPGEEDRQAVVISDHLTLDFVVSDG
jgi:1-phosphofructokinase family hexose kinase